MKQVDHAFWTRLAIIALGSAMIAAGIFYAVERSKCAVAEQAVEVFQNQAMERARKVRSALPPGAILSPVTISKVDREQLDSLELQFQALLHRRDLALGFATRGAVALLALCAFYLFARGRRPNQSPEPTVMSVTPPADAGVAPATTVAHL